MDRLLLDENLPATLATALAPFGLGVLHVRAEGLEGAADQAIWQFAVEQSLILMTKDSDFLDLAAITGVGRVILLTVGNLRLRDLCGFIESNGTTIAGFSRGDRRVLVLGTHAARPPRLP